MEDFPNHCSQSGAQSLAARLAAYWHAQGYPKAKHWTEAVNPDLVGTIWVVRSNLVNGMPPL